VTSGSSLDTNGYVIALDTLHQSVDVNGSALFTKVKPGINTTTLLDVAENCVVPEGNPRRLVVRIGEAAELRFEVVCGVPKSVARNDVAPEGEVAPEQEVAPAEEVAPEDEMAPAEEVAPDIVLRSPAPTMGDFSVGQWAATIEPPEFPAYPVNITFYSAQFLGGIVGVASYEALTWSCSYDLVLENVGDNDLVVAQRLTSGHCPDGNLVVFTREGDSLRGEWLRPDKRPWFEAIFARSR
jgi:hypothetical protein